MLLIILFFIVHSYLLAMDEGNESKEKSVIIYVDPDNDSIFWVPNDSENRSRFFENGFRMAIDNDLKSFANKNIKQMCALKYTEQILLIDYTQSNSAMRGLSQKSSGC